MQSEPKMSTSRMLAKRALDLVLAVPLLLVLVVAFVLVVPIIRLDSRGPAVFRQTRLGRDERPIEIYKFRTLHHGVAEVASHELAVDDVTRVGRILRATKIDELPQVVNVVLGSMSLVGPRPCLPSQTEVIEARRTAFVFAVRPGITGWAQLANIDMSEPQVLAQVDALWIRKGSATDDLRTLLATVPGPVDPQWSAAELRAQVAERSPTQRA